MYCNNIKQFYIIINKNNTILDLMPCNTEFLLTEAKPLLIFDEHHLTISLQLLLIHSHFIPNATNLNFSFYNANYDFINENLMLDILYSEFTS